MKLDRKRIPLQHMMMMMFYDYDDDDYELYRQVNDGLFFLDQVGPPRWFQMCRIQTKKILTFNLR